MPPNGPWPTRRHGLGRLAAIVLAAGVLAGCAALAPPAAPDGIEVRDTTWTRSDLPLAVHWMRPAGAGPEPRGLVVMQHGFTRRCHHLTGLRTALARAGWTVVCVDLPNAAGDDDLARDLAAALVGGALAPPGVAALPSRVVVGGFSAGAVLAVRLGVALHREAPARLAGALLLDPVDVRGFGDGLQQVAGLGGRPVLAVLANPGPCNAWGSAREALQAQAGRPHGPASDGRDGGRLTVLQLLRESTHVDAEAEDMSELAIAACRQGSPAPHNVAALRALATAWLATVERPSDEAHFRATLAPLEAAGTVGCVSPGPGCRGRATAPAAPS